MKKKKWWIFVSILAVLLVCNHIFGWSSAVDPQKVSEVLGRMVEENLALAIVCYVGFTVVGCVLLALPGVTFAILAGVLFGPLWGTLLCSVATTAGALIAFLASRFFLKDTIKPMVEKNRYIRKWLFDESGKNELFLLMITRLVPVFPFNLQNFAYGITDISFATYTVGSMIFMLPGTAMYTIGAAGISDAEHRTLYLVTACAVAAAVIALGAVLKKKFVTNDENGR